MSEWVRKERKAKERGGGGRESSIQWEKGPQIQKAEEWQAPEWDLLGETRRREMGKMDGAWRRRDSPPVTQSLASDISSLWLCGNTEPEESRPTYANSPQWHFKESLTWYGGLWSPLRGEEEGRGGVAGRPHLWIRTGELHKTSHRLHTTPNYTLDFTTRLRWRWMNVYCLGLFFII